MEDITKLEKKLNEAIKNLILGKSLNEKELLFNLDIFFKNKRQDNIDKLNPTNIRLFTITLEILRTNKKIFPIHLANLDYIYSYESKPLKYNWKSSGFDLSKDTSKIKIVLNELVKALKLEKVKTKQILEFFEQAIEMYTQKYSSDIEEIGIFNKNKDTYIYLEYQIFDDGYRNERNGEFNILLVTQKSNALDILPNNEGAIYSNLIFKEK